MFCPTCRSLLRLRRTRDGVVATCPRCGTPATTRQAEPGEPVQRDPALPRTFAYDALRPGQAEFLAAADRAIRQRHVLLAHVPTGVGKTAAALAPALEAALSEQARVFFLTPKQSQHRVVVETARAVQDLGVELVLADLISKQAMCPRDESRQLGGRAFTQFCAREIRRNRCSYWQGNPKPVVDDLRKRPTHVEAAARAATEHHVCPYKALVTLAQDAQITVLDYNHFFSDLLDTTLDRFSLSLDDTVLVVDEAHNLVERVREHLTLVLSGGLLTEAAVEARAVGAKPLARALDQLQEWHSTPRPDEVVERDAFLAAIEQALERAYPLGKPDLAEFVEALAEAGEDAGEAAYALALVARFLHQWSGDSPSLARYWSQDKGGLVVQDLDVSSVTAPVLAGARAAIVMSGTLHPPEMFADLLGVPADRRELQTIPSPFPEHNRRVVVDGTVTTSMKERSPQMIAAIAGRIADAARHTPGHLAAFAPSYDLLNRVQRELDAPTHELVVEERRMDKQDREALVGKLRRGIQPCLLLGVQGGSLSEGYDFVQGSDNLLKTVLVIGLPYAVPTVETRLTQSFLESRFGADRGRLYGYTAPAVQRSLQAMGRAIRASHHRAFLGLLDRRFAWTDVRRCFPPDLRPEVVHDLGAEVASFFRATPMPRR